MSNLIKTNELVYHPQLMKKVTVAEVAEVGAAEVPVVTLRNREA